MGEPHAHASGDPVLRGAVLPWRMARSAAHASRHGRTGGDRARRSVSRERVVHVGRRGPRLLRFGDDVHRASPRRTLRGADRAASRRRCDRIRRPGGTCHRAAPRRLAGKPRRCDGCRGVPCRRRLRAGPPGRVDSRRRRGRRRPRQRRGGDPHRRVEAANEIGRRAGAGGQRRPRRCARARGHRGRRRNAARVDRAAGGTRRGRTAASRPRRRQCRSLVRRRAALHRRADRVRVVAARSGAGACGDVRGPRRVLPLRIVARDTGRARGRGRCAGAPACGDRARRCARIARARDARRLRQDRHAHGGEDSRCRKPS